MNNAKNLMVVGANGMVRVFKTSSSRQCVLREAKAYGDTIVYHRCAWEF